jgi:AcrR family transcriptional regulator
VRSARVGEIVAVAHDLLATGGPEAVSMRNVADRLGIKAPSLYKHVRDKAALESLLVADGLEAMGRALHEVVARGAASTVVRRVLRAYREHAAGTPELYRLATAGELDRAALPAGLEEWAGAPFWLACGKRPYRAQALWGAAHGMTVLELDGRFADTSDLDRSWRELAAAFTD